jgi:hypothetical protein
MAVLQPAWPQLHASSVVSRASLQYWLQYLLPFTATHEQAGCAHLFFSSINSPLPFGWMRLAASLVYSTHMDTEKIIDALKAERERIDRAIGVLDGSSRGGTGRRRGGGRRGPRHMSAEARARIAAAQRRRWAKVKAQKKK